MRAHRWLVLLFATALAVGCADDGDVAPAADDTGAAAADASPADAASGGSDAAPDASADEGKPAASTHAVRGTVEHDGAPLADAQVSLDDRLDWTARTDEAGRFDITGVTPGEHDLKILKTFDDGRFTLLNGVVGLMDTDLVLDALRLPKAVSLAAPTDVAARSATLSWSATDADDFREYKLYRHSSSGLDETTGELIHVSTIRGETTFVDDDLDPLSERYYRVFVLNEFGQLGGSNIVAVTTPNENLLRNPGFEAGAGEGAPEGWDYSFENQTWHGGELDYAIFAVDDEAAHDGARSLRVRTRAGLTGVETFLGQRLDPALVEAGARYRVAAQIAGLRADQDVSAAFGEGTSCCGDSFATGRLADAGEGWRELAFDLTVPAGADPTGFILWFEFWQWSETEAMDLRLDSVSLQKVDPEP